ncbi:MAG: UDP-N-acetylmuramoyl-L-alanine--D-glutamate ligase [Dehalococcoidia bacterium]|nr:UDP-N-acetylmuramoyl-L-alanine--D-glutamate ligase [Dehalococcoidia bacterium]
MTDMQMLREARVTVIGLGIEGIDLVRFLAAEGARVTVSDRRPREELAEALAAIEGTDARLSLGANRAEDATDADMVFVSQGVPNDNPAVAAALAAGVPVSTMLGLFLERCPAPVIGITGSAGKTTTTALVASMLQGEGLPHVMGGNIGIGLLSLLPEIEADTRVVVEMSHTQLERVAVSPHVACVTNVTPNHLDRFAWEDYVALKRRIIDFQASDDVAVLNQDNEVTRGFAEMAPGRVARTSMRDQIAGDGAMLRDGRVWRVLDGETVEVVGRPEVALRGDHNIENLLAAVAVGAQVGVSVHSAAQTARTFTGVPHRLEPIATVAGVLYVNDSIATAPERTLAGLRSFEEPVVLLLGGRDKQLPVRDLAREAASRCRAVVCFGESGDLYAQAVREAAGGRDLPIARVGTVEEAVSAAARLAREGDVVLFAPAATSFDQYRNFEERGRAFRGAVTAMGGRP